MNPQTIRRLNRINADFYAAIAADFDETRGTPWPGWDGILPFCGDVHSLMDAGCGNGRFGLFMAEKLDRPLRYHGVDFSPALLEHARAALETEPRLSVRLTDRDMIEDGFVPGAYDLVGAFGLMHHIPGREYRRMFMRQLAGLLAPGGVLAVAFWRFLDSDKLRARLQPWPDGLDAEVEANDYLLDWRRGAHAVRYCHYHDDAEIDALVTATGLRELARYRADGQDNMLNTYVILKADV
jgi:SAM-dependent methyltransferase